MSEIATEFLRWCNSFGSTFHNSPDIINLRFWLEHRKKIKLNRAHEEEIILEVTGLINQGDVEDGIAKTQHDVGFENEIEISNGENDMKQRKRNAKGKPPADKLLRELNPDTMQGKIVQCILDVSNNVNDICDQFFIERHALLTQLNIIARNTGIGYSVTGDDIDLKLPNGVTDPFEL